MKVAILRDNNPNSSYKWELACENEGCEYLSIDLLRSDWIHILRSFQPDICVCRPPGDLQLKKSIFDEKVYMIENFTKFYIYPNFQATYIYENKSALAWFLETNDIPHPKTFVSSNKREAQQYINNSPLPIVAKTLIGATGSGVTILNNKLDARLYVKKAFGRGIRRRLGPNPSTGTPASWAKKTIKSPKYFFGKVTQYLEKYRDSQKGIVLFQEYIEHDFEWRCVKIGNSYFAYKKLKINNKASGAQQFEYGAPPFEILDFTKAICSRFGFTFMSVDLFYYDAKILVNELQVITGHSKSYICKVDGTPGRYIQKNESWIFEAGDFNTNESYNLRLRSIIDNRKNL